MGEELVGGGKSGNDVTIVFLYEILKKNKKN